MIVEMNDTNLQHVAQLAVELWPDCTLGEMHSHFSSVLLSDDATCFLLQDASRFVGFIELSVRNDYVEGADELPVAYIEGLYINAANRHKGFGQLLVQQAEQWARAKGFKQLCSDTELENNQSIGFHKTAGFTEVSRIVCFAKNLD